MAHTFALTFKFALTLVFSYMFFIAFGCVITCLSAGMSLVGRAVIFDVVFVFVFALAWIQVGEGCESFLVSSFSHCSVVFLFLFFVW